MEVPRDLLPGTGQQRITRSRLQDLTASRHRQLSKEHHEIVICLLLGVGNTVTREALLVAPLRTSPCLALSVVRSSDCPEGAAGNRARTCFGGPAACWWLVDAWLPDLKHPRKR